MKPLQSSPITSFKQLINKYKFFIFDCDGVMWIEKELIEGAENIPITLLRNKKNFCFLTNNNMFSRKKLLKHFYTNKLLKDIITENHIYNSGYLTTLYIKNQYPDMKKLFVIGGEDLTKEFVNEGFQVIKGIDMDNKYKLIRGKLDRKCIPEPDIDAVVVGYDEKMNYYKLTYAARVLQTADTKLFGCNIDRNRKAFHGILPSAYSMISSIEACSEKKAEIITKPHPYALDIILNDLNQKRHRQGLEEVTRKDTLMIGDNLMTDIKFANNAGVDSLLVLTGVTSRETAMMVLNRDKFETTDSAISGTEDEGSMTRKRDLGNEEENSLFATATTKKVEKKKRFKEEIATKKMNWDKYGNPTYVLENLKF